MTRWGLLMLALACGPRTLAARGQLLLYVDTDAPLPDGSNADPMSPQALFDELRIEVLAPGESTPCTDCTSDFAVDSQGLRLARASVGIALPSGQSGWRARVRMFAARFTGATGDPIADTTMDTTVALPISPEEGIVEVTAVLHTDDVGAAVGTPDAPIGPILGHPSGRLVGSWPGARRVTCSSKPKADEVCLPGGAFWMGNPRTASTDEPRPRLVVLSPFFITAHEVTVGDFRASGVVPFSAWSGKSDGNSTFDWCSYDTTGSRDDLPMNCVLFNEARQYCSNNGAQLPTEAQLEYAAGGVLGRAVIWGGEAPACEDAVFGLGSPSNGGDIECNVGGIGGPRPAGTGKRDRLALPSGTLVDINGNLGEWAGDLFNAWSESCWSRAGIYRDPSCEVVSPSLGRAHASRTGGWAAQPASLMATSRIAFPTNLPLATVDIGLRCARYGL